MFPPCWERWIIYIGSNKPRVQDLCTFRICRSYRSQSKFDVFLLEETGKIKWEYYSSRKFTWCSCTPLSSKIAFFERLVHNKFHHLVKTKLEKRDIIIWKYFLIRTLSIQSMVFIATRREMKFIWSSLDFFFAVRLVLLEYFNSDHQRRDLTIL